MNKTNHKAVIQRKDWYTPDIFGLSIHLPNISPLPGQFFQIRVSDSYDPFLNRPISVASYVRNQLLLVIRVVGRGTRLLSEKCAGDMLTLLGPFGKGIRVASKKSLIIAGGIGVAPLLFVAQHLKKKRIPATFLYGAKHKKDLVLTRDIRRMSDRCFFIAEHGYKRKSTVLQLLRSCNVQDFDRAYACGPRAMLVELQRMALQIPVFAFCEDFLGCGCGLCLGCAIKYKGEYKRICEDGPVFELSGIEFNG